MIGSRREPSGATRGPSSAASGAAALCSRRATRRAGIRAAVAAGLVAACLFALAACGGRGRPSTVVVIVVDTLRMDRLGLYGYERATTPRLDRWAQRGAVLERCYATSSWTLPSFGSLVTGRYPFAHGAGWKDPESEAQAPPSASDEEVSRPPGEFVHGNDLATRFPKLYDAVPTVAEILSQHGWSTSALVTNSFLRERFGVARGFDRYDFAPTRMVNERSAEWVVDQLLARLESEPAPRLLLGHIMEPHLPYDPQGGFRGRFTAGYEGQLELPFDRLDEMRTGELELTPEDERFLSDAYDEQLGYVDFHLDRLLRHLEAEGILDDGLVLLTADHGEELFEHGGFEHGHSMYDEVLRVPLIVWGRKVRPGRIVAPASLVDIAPTILEAVGLPVPAAIDGRSLWPLLASDRRATPRPLAAQINLYGEDLEAVVLWPYKAIFDRRSARARLYRLDRDPREVEDLAAAEPETVERLYRLLRATVSEEPAATPEPVVIDDELEAELEALGYLGAGRSRDP